MGFFSTDHLPRPVLLPTKITGNTIHPIAAQTHCPKCGSAYTEGKDFCIECGQPKGVKKTLRMDGRIKALDLAQYLNNWLAENPYLTQVRLDGQPHFLANDFDRVGQVSFSQVALSYQVEQEQQSRTYGVQYLYTYRATFNWRQVQQSSAQAMVMQWENANPDVEVVDFVGGKTHCSENGTYHLYALVVFRRKAAPAAKPARKFCPHCGGKLTVENAAFCGNCGKKL